MGQLARGNNMYPGGAEATTGGGPGFGRPPESPESQAQQNLAQQMKVRQQVAAAQQGNPVGPAVNPMASQQGQMNQQRVIDKQKAKQMASAAMQAAARRRMQLR